MINQKAKKASQKSTKVSKLKQSADLGELTNSVQYVREVSASGELVCTITVDGSDVVWIQKWAKKE